MFNKQLLAAFENWTFATISQLETLVSELTRSEIIEQLRAYCELNTEWHYCDGRKGNPTRIERRKSQYTKTKIDLIPDNPNDGRTIPAGVTVAYKKLPDGLYEVRWETETTWASDDELEI